MAAFSCCYGYDVTVAARHFRPLCTEQAHHIHILGLTRTTASHKKLSPLTKKVRPTCICHDHVTAISKQNNSFVDYLFMSAERFSFNYDVELEVDLRLVGK